MMEFMGGGMRVQLQRLRHGGFVGDGISDVVIRVATFEELLHHCINGVEDGPELGDVGNVLISNETPFSSQTTDADPELVTVCHMYQQISHAGAWAETGILAYKIRSADRFAIIQQNGARFFYVLVLFAEEH